MKTYACVVEQSSYNGKWQVPCGSSSYTVLDGRLRADNALQEAIEHFTKTKPNAKGVAVFRASDLGSKGRVIASFPHSAKNLFQSVIFEGCYK